MYVPPIGRDRILAGVVLVLFNEGHGFQEGEIRTYRLMAGLVETALCPVDETNRKVAKNLPATAKAVAVVPLQVVEELRGNVPMFSLVDKNAIYQRCEQILVQLRAGRVLSRARELKKIAVQRATESISTRPLPSLALTAVAVALALTFWMTHGSRGATSPSAAQGSSSVGSFDRGSVIPVEGEAGGQNPAGSGSDGRVATASVRRAWVAGNEIIYIGDDVTVRHFGYKSARQRSANRVAHIGNDVTIRYFAP
jgi:hypothetical protein